MKFYIQWKYEDRRWDSYDYLLAPKTIDDEFEKLNLQQEVLQELEKRNIDQKYEYRRYLLQDENGNNILDKDNLPQIKIEKTGAHINKKELEEWLSKGHSHWIAEEPNQEYSFVNSLSYKATRLHDVTLYYCTEKELGELIKYYRHHPIEIEHLTHHNYQTNEEIFFITIGE